MAPPLPPPMPRPLRALLAVPLLALGLAACDATEPAADVASLDPADLVGTWSLSEYASATEVTSAVDQSVALTHEAGTGGVTVSGVEGAFRYLASASSDSTSQAVGFTLTPLAAVPEHPATFTRLWVASRTDGSYALKLHTDGGTYVATTAVGDPAFTLDGGRLTVPTRTLTDAAGATVTVGGDVAFPTRALRAGEATLVPPAFPEGLRSTGYTQPYIARITFADDGTFTAEGGARVDGRPLQGTWASRAPGHVTATYTFDWGPHVEEYTFSVTDGALVLEHTLGPFPDTAPSLVSLSYLAAPGSFASYGVVSTYRMTAAD